MFGGLPRKRKRIQSMNKEKGHVMYKTTQLSFAFFVLTLLWTTHSHADILPPNSKALSPNTALPQPCLTPKQLQSLDRELKKSFCGTYPPGLYVTRGMYVTNLDASAEKAYEYYLSFQLSPKAKMQEIKRILKQKEKALFQAAQLYQKQDKETSLAKRIAATTRLGDLYLDYHHALCEHVQKNTAVEQEVKKIYENKMLSTLAKNGVPKNLRSTVARNMMRSPHARRLLRCLVERINLQYDEKLFQRAAWFAQKARDAYQKSLQLQKKQVSLHHAWKSRPTLVLRYLRPQTPLQKSSP